MSSSPIMSRSYQFPILGPSAPSSPASISTTSSSKPPNTLFPQAAVDLQPLQLPIAATTRLLVTTKADDDGENKSSEDSIDDIFTPTTSLQSLQAAYDDLVARVDRMRTFVAQQNSGSEEPTTHSSTILLRQACMETLKTRIPLVLHQTYNMIQDAPVGTTAFVKDVRSTFALYRAIQYVDRLQEAMDPTTNQGIEEQLAMILEGLNETSRRNGSNHPAPPPPPPAFRLSPWVASDLCFDLPINSGGSAHYVIPNDGLIVEIESIVEFRAHDQPSVNYARAAATTPVVVTVESCRHVKRNFGLGAGTIGQATIKVRLEPLVLGCTTTTGAASSSSDGVDDDASHNDKKKVWAVDKPVLALQIKEARAVQLNAYPPKPRASIDMNTSYTYGDAGVTITMVITTCLTGSAEEPPNLLVELFMAPPKPM